MLLPAAGRAESALGTGTGVWCRGGLAPLIAGPGNPGGVTNTHYLFWGFVKGRRAFGDGAGRACLLCRGRPAYRRGAKVSCLGQRGGMGAPEEGSTPTPSPPPVPFQNLVQCFLVWGAGPRESAHLAAAIIVFSPYRPCTTRAFSGPLSPRQWSPSDKRACTCG